MAPEQAEICAAAGHNLAIGLRIVLLFVVLQLISLFQSPWFGFDLPFAKGSFNGHSLIVLLGGAFLIHTALKEIFHMLVVHELGTARRGAEAPQRAVGDFLDPGDEYRVFICHGLRRSADRSLHRHVHGHYCFRGAHGAAGGACCEFLQKNRNDEVLGLFVLLLVGVMLFAEGGHLADLAFFGYPIEPMAKSTFYFVVAALVIVDII